MLTSHIILLKLLLLIHWEFETMFLIIFTPYPSATQILPPLCTQLHSHFPLSLSSSLCLRAPPRSPTCVDYTFSDHFYSSFLVYLNIFMDGRAPRSVIIKDIIRITQILKLASEILIWPSLHEEVSFSKSPLGWFWHTLIQPSDSLPISFETGKCH